MSDLGGHPRRGAHRAGVTIWRAVLPSLLALASVASLIVALMVWRGDSGSQAAAVDPAGAPTASASATRSAGPTTSPSRSVSARPTLSVSSPASAPTPTATALAVVVLNQTRTRGLGARAASTLEAAGWTVAAIGNFRGSVPATTVYYPADHAADAARLAAALPGPDRIRPRFGNLSATRLTVVVTSDYPG